MAGSTGLVARAASARRISRRPRVVRRVAALTGWLAMFTGAGVAMAAWTVTGSGSGTAKGTTAVTVNVTTDTGPAAELYPGYTGSLYFKLDNANPFPVTFTSMTPGAVSVDAGHSGCAPASYVTVVSRTGLSIAVPANTPPGSAVARSISSAVTLSSSAPDSCQGAVFTIAVSLSGTSS